MTRAVVLLLTVLIAAAAQGQERRPPPRAAAAKEKKETPPEGRVGGGGGQGPDLSHMRLVDLSHDLGSATTAWPGSSQHFRLDTITAGRNAQGNYAALFAFSAPEHFGTHMDAPHHFSERGPTTAQVPLWRLMAPAVVIDISDSARANRDYVLTVGDITRFEEEHGRIAPRSIVLLRTGYAAAWSDRARYFGWDSTVTPVQLHFPSFGEDAVKYLIAERRVAAVGTDVASTDAGAASGYPVHRLLADAGVPGFENLADMSDVPPKGAFVVALTPRIVGGSGGPLRAVALVPGRERGERR